jgi:ATP-dependent Lhr-like helicase
MPGKSVRFKRKPDTKEELLKFLHPYVRKWFFGKFKDFSLPQLYGVLEIHQRNNVLISAPTGATKTLTGFLSILNELVGLAESDSLEDKTYAIYISPLKALNNDIFVNLIKPLEEIQNLANKNLGIRVSVRTGDTSQAERAKMLKKAPHILITTPESLAILLTSKRFSEHLSNVNWVIVDEIHSLAESKRGAHLSLSLEGLELLSPDFTRIGLSATVAPIEEIAKFLVGDRQCLIVDVQFIKNVELKVINTDYDLVEKWHDSLYSKVHEMIQQNKTTLIFTNTRAGTERIVHFLQDKYPKYYNKSNIGAHHGSLSKELRFDIESKLREGKLRVIVSSTSLELGIDIGYIDLVILLGSPKSVARTLQRVGRAGHRLHQKARGMFIANDNDELVECTIIAKNSIEKKIDNIHIPMNPLDVLAQQIIGLVLIRNFKVADLYQAVKRAYNYKELSYDAFREIIDYLLGSYVGLEERHVYAKLRLVDDVLKPKGKLIRMIYMTNLGTIPDETAVKVKVGNLTVGKLDESFLERLKKGDVFVLGGSTYEFRYAKGMTAFVNASVDRPPTVPSWFSEMLPLSFDIANEIGRFRRLIYDRLKQKAPRKEIIRFIMDFAYASEDVAARIYEYIEMQFSYLDVPTDKKLVIENYVDKEIHYYVFHSMFGRRVNDALSRAIAYLISKSTHKDIEIGINDNAFYIASSKKIPVSKAVTLINEGNFRKILGNAIDKTEILKRRFRQCAARSFMILRNYKGREKKVGRQQISSQILINAVKRISENFPILDEARREVLEDLMDVENAIKVVEKLRSGKIEIRYYTTKMPSPFAFNIVLQGVSDVLRMEDKIEFLKRMHEMVRSKIEGTDIKKEISDLRKKKELSREQIRMLRLLYRLDIDNNLLENLLKIIKGEESTLEAYEYLRANQDTIFKEWPKELAIFLLKRSEEMFDYSEFWRAESLKERVKEESFKEELRKDLNKALRKIKLERDFKVNLFRLIDGENDFSDSFPEKLKEIFQGTIDKAWTDRIVKFFMQRYKELR